MTQFDATARINVDLSGFTRAASQASSATGAWTAATNSLATSVNRIETLEKGQAAALQRTLSVYQKMTGAVGGYATALQKLDKVTTTNEQNEKKFGDALSALSGQLAKVEGLSSKEAARLSRTVDLYSKLAKAVDTYASALLKMEQLGSRAAQDQQRQEQAATRNAQAQTRLEQAEARLAQSQQRLEQTQTRLANSEQRVAQGAQQAGTAFDHISSSTFALRSTLQELEQSYQSVLKVFVEIPSAAANAAISQESAFAQVARVVGDADAATNHLFQGLQKISTDLPIDFEATAKIAQLGAQIGITSDQLIQFTRVVAAFSITTGITAETATILIGQIAEMEDLPVTEFENFASAVLYLGTVSAATEQEILTINDSIATVGTVFGLSIQGVLGLSAAFATLRIRPELARGSLTRVFSQLQDAVDSSSHSLDVLATLMGLTTDQVKELKATDPDQFFLRFVQGLKNASENGVSFRAALRDLGINAVRDIDTISRLANNFDVLSQSLGDSYAEYAKNTELQRQSQGIFDTTANRLGNLSDAFQNFLANAGKPLAELIGSLAKTTSQFLDFINAVPKAGIVVGGLVTFLVAGGAAFLAYRLIMIKTLTTLVALREAQSQLGVTSVNLSAVITAFSQVQTRQAAAVIEATQAANVQARTNGVLAASMAETATAVAALSLAENELSVAAAAATAAQRSVGTSAATAAPGFTLLAGATFASSEALTAQQAAATTAVASQERLQLSTAATSTAMVTSAAATTAAGEATVVAGRSMGAAALAAGPWIAGLALVGAAASFLIPAFKHQKSATEELTQSSIDAAGGVGNLAKAIQDDTAAAQGGGPVYREVTVGVNDLTDATKSAAKEAINNAKAQKNAIELVHGSYAALQKQATGTDETAKSSKAYVEQINNANATIESNTKLLKNNTVVIGDNAKAWIESAFDAATSASGITKNSDALKALKGTSIDVGATLNKALIDPKGAAADLDEAIADLTARAEGLGKINDPFDKTFQIDEKNLGEGIKFLNALKGSTKELGDEAASTAVKNELLGTKVEQTATQAQLAKTGFGDVATALQALGETADGSDVELTNLAETIAGFGTPLDAFSAAYDAAAEKASKNSKKVKDANDTAADSLTAFSDAGKVSLDEFEKQLDKIQDAMTNWAGNIVVLAQRLGPDIAKYLQSLGPTAAPLIQKLVDASDKELKKLKPKLAATTADATTALSATILAAIPGIQGASTKTAKIISDAFVAQLQAGKVPFEDTVNQFAVLVEDLNTVKGKPRIELQTSDAKKSLKELQDLVLGTNENGTLDPKGQAQLNNQIFNSNLEALKNQTATYNKRGVFDPKGIAGLSLYEYNQQLLSLKNNTATKSKSGWFDPKGSAKLDTKTIYAQFANLKTASYNTGNKIQANLTRSATVTVGYTYKQNNSPPKDLKVATGGWITGPGGPRDDKIPAMLSNKEFVVNAAAAAQYGPLLEAINRVGGGSGGNSNEVVAKMAGAVPAARVAAPENARALTSSAPGRPQTVIHVTNYYPQAEPTSTTVNRSLAFAASLDGTL